MALPVESISAQQDRVADAPSGHWVYRLLPRALLPYAQLARWDRPIGWWLLLWPCWWSLALALGQLESVDPRFALSAGLLFLVGAIAMRGAGCTYNDLVDERIDARVARTASRPIPSGRVTRRAATAFLVLQLAAGFVVLLALCALSDTFNTAAFLLALSSMLVVCAYPFAKRVTQWPQLVLGLAFSWGALLGWTVVTGVVSLPAILLYAGSIAWVVGYDTIYAHQDKEDDALIGVKSTALLFGDHTRRALIVLYTLAVGFMAASSLAAGAPWPAFIGLALGAVQMAVQIARLDIDDPARCLALFRSNTQFGWLVFSGLLAALAL